MSIPHLAPVRIDQSTGLAQIGATRHQIMGIRFENGEGGAAPAAAPAAPAAQVPAAAPASPATLAAAVEQAHAAQVPPAAAPGAPATPPAAAPAPDAAQQAADAAQEPVNGVKFADLDPATQAYVRTLRGEAQSHRERAEGLEAAKEAREAEIRQALGLDPKPGENTPDPAAQAQELTTSLATAQRENTVLRLAGTLGANADVLLDSRSFSDKISGMNPGDTAAITAAITEFVANHSSARTVTAAGSSGTAGAGNGETRTPAQPATMYDAIMAATVPK